MRLSAKKVHCGITSLAILMLLMACDPAAVKLRQFTVQGEQLYLENCSQCHQADGKGLALLYPPLADQELLSRPDRIACAIRYGANGPREISGKIFNQPMAAVENLTDLEVAEIITYLSATWGGSQRIIEADTVQLLVKKCH